MKKIFYSFVALMAIAMVSNKAMAQTTQSTSADAHIVTPLTLTKTADLRFGAMTSPSSAATCVLGTDGTRVGSGLTLVSSTSFPVSAAAFSVSGTNNATYAITIPSSITVTSAASKTMEINTLKIKAASVAGDQTASYNGALSATGADSFTIGGTLSVGANQDQGDYTATFNVSIAYN